MSYAVTALVPRQFVEKSDVVGARWGNEVRVLSRPGTEAGANLAEGPVAEGWVVAGWAGVAVSLLALFVLTIMVARILGSNSIFLAVLGLALTSQPYLFERGALAAAEGIGKGLQVAVVAGLVLAFLRLETAEVAVTRATGRMLDEAPARG